MTATATVAWHDVECHAYDADLALWRALAEREPGPVLDVGAGTGRVALDLAEAGHEVVALDVDAVLLDALCRRGAERGVAVEAVVGDAEAFDLGVARFNLVIVPMQTVQLLADRPAFLRSARRALCRGGLLAAAIADGLAPFDPEPGWLPHPDVGEFAGWRYTSQPTAIRVGPERVRLERVRTAEGPGGERTIEANAIELALLDAAGLAREARAAGLQPVPGRRIAPTGGHAGSSVVMARA